MIFLIKGNCCLCANLGILSLPFFLRVVIGTKLLGYSAQDPIEETLYKSKRGWRIRRIHLEALPLRLILRWPTINTAVQLSWHRHTQLQAYLPYKSDIAGPLRARPGLLVQALWHSTGFWGRTHPSLQDPCPSTFGLRAISLGLIWTCYIF